MQLLIKVQKSRVKNDCKAHFRLAKHLLIENVNIKI